MTKSRRGTGECRATTAVCIGMCLVLQAASEIRPAPIKIPPIASPLRDVPFRAVQVIVRRAADGVTETRGKLARSSDGSTYVELVNQQTRRPAEILIFDVPHRIEFVLDVARRTYRMTDVPALAERDLPSIGATEQIKLAEGEKGRVLNEVDHDAEVTRKSLGVRRIAGLESIGSMLVRRALPGAGEVSDGPAEVDESWISVELGVAVLRVRHDPLTDAETEVALTEIVRAEPDRDLFRVPAGYTLEEAAFHAAEH